MTTASFLVLVKGVKSSLFSLAYKSWVYFSII